MHDVAFQIGGIVIYWYGILAATGFLLAFWTASRRAPRSGIEPDAVTALAPWLIGGAIIGARVLYVATYWKQEFAPLAHPWVEVFKIRSGLVFYGGLVGASFGTFLYARRHRVALWKLADVLAPSIALGHVFGRIGCFMTGCCYGSPCERSWAVHFPKDHATAGAGVHPSQLYESILNLALYFILARLHQRKTYDGQVFGVYLVSYACLRAAVETFRGDYTNRFLGLFSPAQLASPLLLGIGLFLLAVLRRRNLAQVRRDI